MAEHSGLRSSKKKEMETPAKGYADQELLSMRPQPGSDHEAWREYHRILFEHGKLTAPES